MGIAIPNNFRKRQRGGRRRDTDPPYNKVRHHLVVDDDFYDMIEAERRPYETNNDVLWRIFRERTDKIRDFRKKVDALEQTRLPTSSGVTE